jgi:uncharacterized repeat protein (TIGR02059 family)
MKRILIPIFLAFFSSLSATTYYVSTSGNNANNGLTTSTPWQTLQYAESHATQPGDIIALKKGDVWASTTCLAIKHSGSSAYPITWDGSLWGTGENAVIKSSGNRSSGNDAIVNIIACSYVTFQNITVDGNNTQTYGLVIGGHSGFSNNNQSNENNIIIDGCSILNIGNGGDYRLGFLCQTWNSSMSNITIQNCTLDGSDDEQLSFYPGKTQDGGSAYEISNILIKNNRLTNWGRRGASTGYGMQINNKCTNAIIEYNTLIQGPNGKGDAFHLESNEQVIGYMPTGVIVRYNQMTVSRSNEWCVIIQQGQAKTADFYQNLFIQGNNQTDADGGAIWIIVSSSPSYSGASLNFYNNTIYTTSGRSFQNDCGSAGVSAFRNNIIYNAGTGSSNSCVIFNTSGSTVHSNNLFFRKAAGELLYVRDGNNSVNKSGVTGWESTGKNSDPLFYDLAALNFHLQTGSPASGSGITISGITNDIEGTYVGNPPSMGCYEAVSGTPQLTYSNSSIENANPNILVLNFNLSLTNIIPDPSAFSVLVNSISRTVNSVAISGSKVQLTLSSPVVAGDIVTVAYTKPASNQLQTSSGLLAASMTAQAVTNNVSAVTPVNPVYVSSSVDNASPALLSMTYNLTLANIVPAVSAFTVIVNSVARTVSSVAISATKVQLTLSSPVVNGDKITVAYTKPAGNPIQTASGGQAVSITAQTVTNNVSPAVPVYVSSAVENATPTLLSLTYNLALANIIPAASVFSVRVNNVSRTISTVTISSTKVQLTLSSPIVFGDVITVAYTKPSSNPIQTASGGQAVSISAQPVTNNVNSAVPVYVSSAIENATPSLLSMNYNLALANIVPASSVFTVLVNNVTRTISTVTISSTKVQLTLSTPVVFGDVITVAYTKPSSNPIQTAAGGQAVSISPQTVTNNVISAVPVYVSSAIENATPSLLSMNYNLALANIVPASSVFTVLVNNVARNINTVSISGTKIQLTLSSPVVNGDLITVAYTKPASNPIQTASGGQASSITAQSVTNNVNPPIPVYVSSAIENSTPSILSLTYNLTLANIIPAASAFQVMVNNVARTINTVAISGTKVQITLATPVVNGDVITIAYTKPASNPVQTAAGGQAGTMTAQAVTNNVNPAIPVYVSSSIDNATPAVLSMTYSLALANIVPAASAFSVSVNGVARTISTITISGTKVQLTLSSPVIYSDVVTVTYTKPASNPVQTPAGGQAASSISQPVTNNVTSAIPVYTGSVIENASPSVLVMNYNMTLANIVPAASAFTVLVNNVARPVSSVLISGTTVQLTLSSPVVYGDIITVAYTKPASNPLQKSLGFEAVTMSAQTVVNNVSPVNPVYVSSVIENATPSIISITYSLPLANIVPATSAFTVRINNVVRTVTAVSVFGTTVQLTLGSPVANGNSITLSYTKPASKPLQTSSGAQAASIATQTVTNNVSLIVPAYVSSVIENVSPSLLSITFSVSLANIVPYASSFKVLVNNVARSVSKVTVSGTKVQLTLSSAVSNGNVVTVAYTRPSRNPLQTSSGVLVTSMTAQSVINNVDPLISSYVSSVIENITPSLLTMTFSLSLANIVPDPSAFAVLVNNTVRTVKSVAISGATVQLTLSSPVVYGDIITVAYTKPATNPLQSTAGGQSLSITAQPVVNNVSTVNPIYVSSVIENSTPTLLSMTYNLTLANIVPSMSAFTVLVNNVTVNVTKVTISGIKVLLTLSAPVVYGDVITVSYSKPSSNPLQTATGGQAGSIVSQSVTNNVNPVNPPVPSFISSVIENATPSILSITYDLSLANIVPASTAFTVRVNNVVRPVTKVTISDTKVLLSLANPVINGDIVTIDYTQPSVNQLQTTSGGMVVSMTSQKVVNNVNPVSPDNPVYQSSVIENATPALLEITYNMSMAYIVPDFTAFTVMVNSVSAGIDAIDISGTKIRITLSDPVDYGDIITFSYTKPVSNPLQSTLGGQAASTLGQNVTNNVQFVKPVSPALTYAAIENANASLLEMVFDLNLANITPLTSDFNVQVNSEVRTINKIAISGTKVLLTLDGPVIFGDVVTVSYIQPSTNPVQSLSGGLVQSLSMHTVINRVSFVNSPPVIVINYKTDNFSGFIGEIDASESYDPDIDNLTFEWTAPADIEVSSTNNSRIQFLAPIVSENLTLEFTVKVSDGKSVQSQIVAVNILPYKPGLLSSKITKVTSSNVYLNNYAEKSFDGNLETGWSADGANQWISFQLDKPFEISYFEIAFQKGQKKASYFDLYASKDGVNWDPVILKAASSNFSSGLQVFDIPDAIANADYSFIKLVGQGNSEDSWNYISEFKIFGKQHLEEMQMTIYPNPAHDLVNFTFKYPTVSQTQDPLFSTSVLRILDSSGRMVLEQKMDPMIENLQLPINYKSGIYIVQVVSGGLTVSTGKLIVIN